MNAYRVSGLIFANSHDSVMKRLTKERSMASVPFGGRYRVIDFALSNFVNAGITNIAVITKENYRSLMDHIGSGVYWDLDRKSGGIHIMPPFNIGGNRFYHGYIEALYGALDFLERCNSEYMVLSEAGIIANIDIAAAVDFHKNSKSDFTVIYKKSSAFENKNGAMSMVVDDCGKVVSASVPQQVKDGENVSVGIYIANRDVLISAVRTAYENGAQNFERDLLLSPGNEYKISAFWHKEFCAVLDRPKSYNKASMDLLKRQVRDQLFTRERPIFTKTRDDMPTRYGINAKVNNCFIADGCVIEGTVENSIIFRGVTVGRGAKVSNCIIMQGGSVGENAEITNVIADKNATIGSKMTAKGTEDKFFFIEKGQKI